MDDVRVFPGLQKSALFLWPLTLTYSWESTVVPEVALVGEAVAHESKLALLNVLLDGVEKLLLGDLAYCQWLWSV